MTSTHRQLAFDLPHRPAQGAEDFFVSASNAAAVELVDRWPDWQHWAGCVVGPQGAGKTHLAHVWQRRSGAAMLTGSELGEPAVAALKDKGALAI
jgi:chromosomal replication initiation ATPase DnaA